jgi:hypothetical protein
MTLLETFTLESQTDPTQAGHRFLAGIHAEIDLIPIHEMRATFVASDLKDAMAGITLSYLTRNEQYENEDRHEEKSALAETLSV